MSDNGRSDTGIGGAGEVPEAGVVHDEGAVRNEPAMAELMQVLDELPPSDLAGPRLPTPAQVATALAMIALVSPAALGGIPVLPVTIEEDRRRHQDEIQQISESSVGVHQDVQAAATALVLSQGRLAQVTREVERLTKHDISETDVVHAAHQVLAGKTPTGQRIRFQSALSSVANDSVDLFILSADEQEDARRQREDELLDDMGDEDLDAWLSEFE
ncbi:MAG: hypothetical protein IKG11_05640 [Atopobiaceae bacterium]|nr:hypothetical protein [Atopobiaceae bacterium]